MLARLSADEGINKSPIRAGGVMFQNNVPIDAYFDGGKVADAVDIMAVTDVVTSLDVLPRFIISK